jgi:hypothetical protein
MMRRMSGLTLISLNSRHATEQHGYRRVSVSERRFMYRSILVPTDKPGGQQAVKEASMLAKSGGATRFVSMPCVRNLNLCTPKASRCLSAHAVQIQTDGVRGEGVIARRGRKSGSCAIERDCIIATAV